MEELIECLSKIREDVDFKGNKKLVTGGIISSFDIIQIVNMIKEKYEISVPYSALKPANFDSAEALWNMIQELTED